MRNSKLNAFPTQPAYSLLVIVAVTMVVSWWLANYNSPETNAAAEDLFLAGVDRAGASTDGLVSSLQARLREQPDDWQAYSQLGLAYLQKSRETGDPTYYQKAEGAFQEALSRQSEDYASISAMGALALARHQFSAALDWAERARQINPSRPYAYGVIADAEIELGRYEDAVQTLQAMVDLRPDMSSYARISYLRELYGDIDGALETMQMAVDSGVPKSESTAWTRTQFANLYFNNGKLERAEIEYLRALEGYPGYVYALAGLGRVRAAQGRMNDAVSLLTRAGEAMPLPEFIIALGDLYQITGQPEAVRKQHELLSVMQRLYQANGVDMDLEIALFNADHDLALQSTLAQAYQAYERRPSTYAADVLAWVLYKAGDYREAQKFSQQALRLGTKDALKLFHAGMIHYRLGDHTQARRHLELALAINPHFSLLYAGEAQRTLDELATASSDN